MQKIIDITDGITRHPDFRMAVPVNFRLFKGVHMAVCGPNGGGKSFLVEIIRNARPLLGDQPVYDFSPSPSLHVSENIAHISFRDAYGVYEPAYYQQRWNKGTEEEFPTVETLLGGNGALSCNPDIPPYIRELIDEVGIKRHAGKSINLLSSGELRRFQLTKALLSAPQLLIIDNPFIGLDAPGRQMLTNILEKLSRYITILLVVSRPADIPTFIQEVVHVEGLAVSPACPREDYLRQVRATDAVSESAVSIPQVHHRTDRDAGTAVVDLHNVTIAYGNYTILKDLNWSIRRGEHWTLSGNNGTGKSTLLSLICADNPAGYACDIRLFGRRRGHGESIWDIKKNIGFVSPELFQSYRKPVPVIDIVASGLHDSIGLYKRSTPEERAHCMDWLQTFKAGHLADRNFMKLSSGEQRLVLLARAFVKNPGLLILDEPFHGLDDGRRKLACHIIDRYMEQPDKTLVMVSHYEDEYPQCIDHHLTLTKNS